MWKPALIANPAYYKDETPLANIGKIDAVAIEIWTMDSGFFFDDIVVANDPSLAAEFREKTYGPKKAAEVCSCRLEQQFVSDIGSHPAALSGLPRIGWLMRSVQPFAGIMLSRLPQMLELQLTSID